MANLFVSVLLLSSLIHAQDIRMPPKMIQSSPQYMTPFQPGGSAIVLLCEAQGIPDSIEYEWLKDSQILDLNAASITRLEHGSISVEAKAGSEGYYQCIASNQWGKVRGENTHVPMAVLIYPTGETRTEVSTVGESLQLPCLLQESVPAATLEWGTVEDEADTSLELLVLNKRISIGLDDALSTFVARASAGTLYFSYLSTNEISNRIYRCSARNPILAITAEGSSVRLDLAAATPVDRRPTLLTASSEVVVLEGEQLSLKCFFAAFPEASVKWDYSDTNPPASRRTLTDFDTQLQVTDVQKSDEGTYKCWGQNSAGESEKVLISVDVQSKPTFLEGKELEDINGFQGDTVTFRCAATAEPEAETTWYINGEEVDPNSPGALRSLSEGNTALTFKNLCKLETYCSTRTPDLLSVQCNASNIHGYLYRSAILNVLIPVEITVAPESVELKENQTEVMFRCEATADPGLQLSLTWWHDNTEVNNATDERVMVDYHNTLHINFKGASEAKIGEFMGTYTCKAVAGESAEQVQVLLTSYIEPPAEVKSAILEYWWIFVVVVAFLLLVILIVCWCMWCHRNEQIDYRVDDYDRKNGYDPEKELEDQGFQDYVRPTEMSASYSREKLDTWDEMEDMTPYEKNSITASKQSLNSLGRPTITIKS